MTAEWGGAGSLDEKMIADLRAWRDRITPAPSEAERSAGHPYSVQIRLEELDALLAAMADRDALRREACEMPDERAENVTPIKAVHYFGAARVVPVDLATLVDAAVEADERVIAWDQIAAHPFFRDCYGTEGSLLDAMREKLTASTFTAEIPDEVRERAGSTALGIPYAEPMHEPEDTTECQGCAEDIAGGFGLYCSACGKPRPAREARPVLLRSVCVHCGTPCERASATAKWYHRDGRRDFRTFGGGHHATPRPEDEIPA